MRKNLSWSTFLSREGVDITTLSVLNEGFYEYINAYTKTDEIFYFTHVKNKIFTHRMAVDLIELGRLFLKKYFSSKEQVEDLYKKGLVILEEVKKENIKLKRISFPSYSDLSKILENYYKGYKDINYIYSIAGFLAIEAWQSDFDTVLNSLIVRNDLKDQEEKIRASIFHPWKKTALIEIEEKLSRGVPPEKLVRDYQFLRNWAFIWYRPITAEWIKSLGKKDRGKRDLFTPKELKQMLKPRFKEWEMITLAPYMTFFKDWRDDLRRAWVYYMQPTFKLIADKLKISLEDLGYLTIDEIREALSTQKMPLKLIQKRKAQDCFITFDFKSKKVLVAKDDLFYRNIISKANQTDTKLIKGVVASIGMAEGKVKVIKSFHDIKHVQDGDIMVANTTHPNYLPAMRKAAAFVTNEGGIISHAAIVAREMKKPCIVGTKNATKVLKDGDLVEVNANNGIVKVLKSGK